MGSFVNGETLNDKAILLIIRYLLFDLADRYAADVTAGDLVYEGNNIHISGINTALYDLQYGIDL